MANSGARPNSASSSFPCKRSPRYSEGISWPGYARCSLRESCIRVAVDAQHQTVTFTYRDYRHGSQLKELTLCALEFIRRFSLHILPPGLVRIRHYGILGNNRRKRTIEAARAIFKRRGHAVELQPQSIADPPCGAMCCPLCGKAGIRLVAFTDAAGFLHNAGLKESPLPAGADTPTKRSSLPQWI